VNSDGKGDRLNQEVDIPCEGQVVPLKGFGFVKVLQTVSKDRDAEYWATNDLKMSEEKRKGLERRGWEIEVYHQVLKQCYGLEKAQVRKANSILRHLLLVLRFFEAGGLSVADGGDELVLGEGCHHSGCHSALSDSSFLCPPSNCVTPT